MSAVPAAPPLGVVTFLAAHGEVLRAAVEAHGGYMFKHTGDGVCACVASISPAATAAAAAAFVEVLTVLQIPIVDLGPCAAPA